MSGEQLSFGFEDKTEAEGAVVEMYSGVVRLALAKQVDYESVKQFHELLSQMENLRLMSIGGSANEGTKIVVSIVEPIPLLQVLGVLPIVEQVFKKDDEIQVDLKSKLVA